MCLKQLFQSTFFAFQYSTGLLPLKRLLSQGHYELRIDLEDFDGYATYAKYDTFNIGDFTENYTLKISDYSGTAGKVDFLYFT